MPARRAWYRSSDYEQPCEKTLGDGSKVMVVKDSQGIHTITRKWPSGFVQAVTFHFRPDGSKEYLETGSSPDDFVTAAERNRMSEDERSARFEAALRDGEVRVTARGPIPGAGLGVVQDPATKEYFTRTKDYDKRYEELGISRATRSDISTRHKSRRSGFSGKTKFSTFTGDAPAAPTSKE